MSSLSIYLKIAAWRELSQRQSLCVFFPPWFQNAWGQEREESGLMSWKTHPTQNQPIFMILLLFGSITYRIMLQLLITTLKAFIKLRSHCIPLHISQPGHMKLSAISQTTGLLLPNLWAQCLFNLFLPSKSLLILQVKIKRYIICKPSWISPVWIYIISQHNIIFFAR